jgi:hypothetical protein
LLLLTLLAGFCIGFTFEKGKIFLPAVIRAQMTLNDFSMMKMFLAGTAVGMFSLSLLIYLELQKRVPVKLSLGLQVSKFFFSCVSQQQQS